MFENRVLKRIFGPKRDEVTGEWRKLHTEELNDPYSSPNIFREIKIENNEMGRACSTNGEGRGVFRVLVGRHEGKRPLERPRRTWESNIKMDRQEVGCGVWTGLSWLRIETGGRHL
jgi:hypothetical protein